MGVVVDTGVFVLWERRGHSVEKRLSEIDLNVARIHAQLSSELTQKGTTIGYQDLWIAATAMNHDYAVMTANASEFSRIQNLEVIPIETT